MKNYSINKVLSTWITIVIFMTLFSAIPTVIHATAADWSSVPLLYQGRYRPASLYHEKNAPDSWYHKDELAFLPAREGKGKWLPLSSLKENSTNLTLYPDALFQTIQTQYLTNDALLPVTLSRAYEQIAGTPYLLAFGKTLTYPTVNQLKAEHLYYRLPLIPLCIAAYLFALILFAVGTSSTALVVEILAFSLHTAILGLRIYILGRPPVANMFETILYVPWFAVLGSLLLARSTERKWMLIASNSVSIGLLTLLLVTRMEIGMENVQAVLDSQYWLIVHVLLVVGSYGIFALAGVLGHLFFLIPSKQNPIAHSLLKSLYLGTGMLIAGTLLGGVWAAQSWGRFWDWDPKESWAFISICIYVIGIHLYRFHRIGDKGLAMGAIIGLQAIAFTWYGVNYILGTGLHSYGFGNGGETYFYLFLFCEIIFLIWAAYRTAPSEPQST